MLLIARRRLVQAARRAAPPAPHAARPPAALLAARLLSASAPEAPTLAVSPRRATLPPSLDVRRIPPSAPPGELAFLLPGHVRHLAHRLAAAGITTPTACQAAAMPALASAAGPDVLLQSVTGSGKTLAYAAAVLARLDAAALGRNGRGAPPATQALIVVPTRELAVQVTAVLTALAGPPSAKRKDAPLRISRLVGLPTTELIARLRREPPHIAIATPALAAALVSGDAPPMHLGALRTLVLDEADELLAAAIAPSTRAVLKAASARAGAQAPGEPDAPLAVPTLRRYWVSATVTPEVVAAASAESNTAVLLFTDAGGDVDAAAAPAQRAAAQAAMPAPRLPAALTHWRVALALPSGTLPDDLKADEERAAVVARLHAALQPKGPMLVFSPSAERAAPIVAALGRRSFRAAALTATAPAERRARAALLRGVRAGRTAALVTTEMGARGLDLPRVALVVNAVPPAGGAGAYLHRAGRAGRHAPGASAPAPGAVVTLVADAADGAAVDATAAALGIQVPLARLERGKLLGPDGAVVTLPPPPPRFVPGAARGGAELSAALGGGRDDEDEDKDGDDEEDAPPPKQQRKAQPRKPVVHKARDSPQRASRRAE